MPAPPDTAVPSVLVIACGALARELLDITRLNGLEHVSIECLPAKYHMEPAKITPAIIERVERARGRFDRILIGYADCGTQGQLDAYIEQHDLERLPGAHCYEFFAGAPVFARLHDAEPGTFYLTDYLVKHFDRVVWVGLGLDRHPQLLPEYFGNYTRLLYLAQTDDPALVVKAEAAAERLGLRLEIAPTAYGDLETSVVEFTRRRPQTAAT